VQDWSSGDAVTVMVRDALHEEFPSELGVSHMRAICPGALYGWPSGLLEWCGNYCQLPEVKEGGDHAYADDSDQARADATQDH